MKQQLQTVDEIKNVLLTIQGELSKVTMNYQTANIISGNLNYIDELLASIQDTEKIEATHNLTLTIDGVKEALIKPEDDEIIVPVPEPESEDDEMIVPVTKLDEAKTKPVKKTNHFIYTNDFITFLDEEKIKEVDDVSEYYEGRHMADRNCFRPVSPYEYYFTCNYMVKVTGEDKMVQRTCSLGKKLGAYSNPKHWEKRFGIWSRKLPKLKEKGHLIQPSTRNRFNELQLLA